MWWAGGGRWKTAAALVIAAGALLGPATAATSAPAVVWGPVQPIQLSSSLGMYPQATAISCPAPGDCVAAGHYYNGALPGFLVEETNGIWGAAEPIPGLPAVTGGSAVNVYSISCASPGNCAMAGSVDVPQPGGARPLRGFVLSETNGAWGTADIPSPPVAAASVGVGQLRSVSCSAPGDCVAGGYDTTDAASTEAEVIEETDGTWGAPSLLSGAPAYDQVTSVSCAGPGECAAGLGETRTGYTAALATQSGGSWSVQAVPGLSALAPGQVYSSVNAVSCAAPGDCTAAGGFTVPTSAPRLFVLSEQDGSWGQASEPPGSLYASLQIPLSCPAPGECALAASGVIIDQLSGTWSVAANPGIAVTAISCPATGNCLAIGGNDGTSDSASVISETNGAWGKAVQVADTGAALAALSCPTADSCVATGTDGSNGPNGFFVAQVPVAATTTALSVSAQSVTYGHEQTEKVTVAVSAASGTPTGSVTLRAGGVPVCTVGLIGGTGSCALSATQFGAGLVSLGASYSGPAWYATSSSSATSLRVSKAGTRVALRLSARTARYHREKSERLSVRVTPQYAGPVPGTIRVVVGRRTVCVVRLSHGAGTCRLSASELRPGSYRLVARYAGSADFGTAASGAATLRVTRP